MNKMQAFVAKHQNGVANKPASPARDLKARSPAPLQVAGDSRSQLPPARSRQEAAAVNSLPLPKPKRNKVDSQQAATTSAQHMVQGLPFPIEEGDHANGPNGGAWEDSTVASMFEDDEARVQSGRSPGHRSRQYSGHAYESHSEDAEGIVRELRFEGGFLTFSGQGGGTTAHHEAFYRPHLPSTVHDEDQHNTTPTKHSSIGRVNIPHHGTPEAKRLSFAERMGAAEPNDIGLENSSQSNSEDGIDVIAIKDGEAKREREEPWKPDLHHKRATVFEDISPVDEPEWSNQAAIGTQAVDVAGRSNMEALQQTPRSSRQPLPSQTKAKEGSLTRTSSRRLEKAPNKRPRSLDYDDAELNSMVYADLDKQDFDFDPQAAALQQTSAPVGTSIEDKLTHYKDKDSLEQHQFFTQMSLQDWETSGDWFLEQFGDVMRKVKEARKKRRDVVEKFEREISAREETVRGQINDVDQTLRDMKQDGQNLMSRKKVDL